MTAERTPSPWPRIDAWLAKNAPEVFAKLRPPAREADLAKLAEALGRPLHPAIVDAYRAHDGAFEEHSTVFGAVRTSKNTAWAQFMWWLSAEDALSRLVFMRDLGFDWPEGRMPIAEDAGGNLIVVDLQSGAVSGWDHEDWSTSPLASDFGGWMTQLADDMAANLVEFDEDEEEGGLILLDAAPSPAAAAALAPDRAARVLIEVMLERRLIALAERFDVEPLIAELTEALDVPSEKRTEKVIAVLEDSEVVDEIFADDEVIEKLIEEIG